VVFVYGSKVVAVDVPGLCRATGGAGGTGGAKAGTGVVGNAGVGGTGGRVSVFCLSTGDATIQAGAAGSGVTGGACSVTV
jgi:hypothetical protein